MIFPILCCFLFMASLPGPLLWIDGRETVTFAHQLERNLLLVHGTGDDNVHQNFKALANELIKHNKQFTMMSYPNRTHGIKEGENTTHHLYELLTKYLKENLPPGAASE